MSVIVKCGGGENVTPEVTAQTPVITQILEGLVGKAQGANITPETVLKGFKGYRGQELVEGVYVPHGAYVWKKLTAEGGDFVDFVTADVETAYPDGGEQGGYWYEKFYLDPALFGCTKYAVDKFTLSSLTNVYNGYTVNHSLGEVPKVIFLSTPEEITYGYRCIRRYIQFPVSAGLAYAVVTNNTAGGDDKYGAKVNGYGSPFNAPTNSQVTITEQLSKYEYLQSGIEYTLITMA